MQPKLPENEDQVKLKPFYGIRPGVYLTVIYSFILLTVFFLLFLLPGIKNPGVMLIVKTEPAGAAIRVNDVYMGLSGSRIFVPKGTHTIEAVMPGFESQSAVHTVPSRIFGSLFFPRLYRTEFTLKTSDPAAAFAFYASDFSEWTFAGEPTVSWQIPLSLSEGVYRVGPYVSEYKNELNDILMAAARFAVTNAAMKDLIRAKILFDNNGCAPSPLTLLYSISDIMAFLSQNPESARWLAEIASSEFMQIIWESAWYKNMHTPSLNNERPVHLGTREISGITFNLINDFMISENPVSKPMFETFLNENPLWREHLTDYYPNEISVNPMEILYINDMTAITW